MSDKFKAFHLRVQYLVQHWLMLAWKLLLSLYPLPQIENTTQQQHNTNNIRKKTIMYCIVKILSDHIANILG